MKTKIMTQLVCFCLLPSAFCLQASAQGTTFTYQGRLDDGANPASGSYDLTFRLFNASSLGSQVGVTLTNTAVALSNGLFIVALDFGNQYPGANRWLEIAVRTNGGGAFVKLAPRQQLTPTPYSITSSNLTGTVAASQITGTLTSAQILDGTIVNADINAAAGIVDTKLATIATAGKVADTALSANVTKLGQTIESAEITDGTIVGADLANDTITSAQLADDIDLGTTNVTGRLDVFRTLANTASISLNGGASQISTFGSDGLEQIRLWGVSWGEILLYDSTGGNNLAAKLSANNDSGSILDLNQANSSLPGLRLAADFANLGARVQAYNSSNALTFDLRGQYDSVNSAAWAGLYDNGSQRIAFAARDGTSGRGGTIDVKNGSALNTIRLIGDTGFDDSKMEMYAGGTNRSLVVLADDSSGGSAIYLYDGAARERMEIDSDDGDDAAIIRMRDSSGSATIVLDAEAGGQGRITTGRITTDVLRTTGIAGIGRDALANMLEVEGNASKTAAGSWLANSDARIKQDIQPVRDALETLARIRPVSFRYTDEYRAQHPSVEDRRYLNVVAQEFQKVFPEDVKRSGEKLANGDDILQVDTYPVTIYSCAAIQELNAKVEDLNRAAQARILKLEAEKAELARKNQSLEARLDALETFIFAQTSK